MLQEKINKCRILMSSVKMNQQEEKEKENEAKKNNTFFDAYEQYLVPLIRSYVCCVGCDHIEFSDELINDLKSTMEDTKKVFDEKIVINPARYRQRFISLSESLKKEWEEKTRTYLSDEIEDLEILKLVSNEKGDITKVLSCMNNFIAWPVDQGKVDLFYSAKQASENILSQIEFDDEIANFLKKVKEKQATILDLSDTIISWIRKEGLEGNIMLSIKN